MASRAYGFHIAFISGQDSHFIGSCSPHVLAELLRAVGIGRYDGGRMTLGLGTMVNWTRGLRPLGDVRDGVMFKPQQVLLIPFTTIKNCRQDKSDLKHHLTRIAHKYNNM